MNVRIVDVSDRDRFELFDGHHRAGVLHYQRAQNLLVIEHTEVDPPYQGRGYASQLVQAVIDQAKGEQRRVIVVCPFAKDWLQRHPEYAPLDYNHR